MMLWLMLVEIGGMRSQARELYDVMVDAGRDWRDREPCEI